ncbi:terminase, ATPase domain [Microbacterium phage Pumpernickel]|uniref:Terminase, ATPase domain n=1 Tax=Microbacterium phage Pumpernickel TaxID=2885983 RepID=A0AAE8YBF2_9CAUD|nr:terminase, ATPase domain [Microbacterium phage Pumpernickel]UDL15869.1 terminase, ATPase domain [Microbacterium phage Pumpernickel]
MLPASLTLALMSDDALSLRQRIERLPEDEYHERRALFSDEEWNSWTLTAQPWQLEPQDPNWRVWILEGGKAIGKTHAALRWALDLLLDESAKTKTIALFPTISSSDHAFDGLMNIIDYGYHAPRLIVEHDNVSGVKGIRNATTGSVLVFGRSFDIDIWRGSDATHIWADEIFNMPKDWFTSVPTATKFVFTGGKPHRPVGCHVSRPGLPRA